MKKVALIPALLGSTRIPDKNLLLVDGSPMLFYAAEAAKRSGAFDEIVINSEHEVFGEMARQLGVRYYRRDPQRGGSSCRMINKSSQCYGDRCQTHDHFLYDFMESMEPCLLGLVHTTSPLLKPETIREFMLTLEREEYDSLLSAEERRTETLYEGRPLNFSASEKNPTQTLQQVHLITWALSGWRTASFMESYRRNDPMEVGPTQCGKTGIFPLDRIQALDADTWDDLYMIEACLQHRRQGERLGQFKWTDYRVVGIERCLEDLIKRDGVGKIQLKKANSRFSNLEQIKRQMGPAPWMYLLIYSETDQAALICQRPGEGCRNHCHVTQAEWWIVLEGAFEWRLGDGTVLVAKKAEVVSLPRGMPHIITCVGDSPGIRLACGARDFEHVYIE